MPGASLPFVAPAPYFGAGCLNAKAESLPLPESLRKAGLRSGKALPKDAAEATSGVRLASDRQNACTQSPGS
jgi:hypothetical protein